MTATATATRPTSEDFASFDRWCERRIKALNNPLKETQRRRRGHNFYPPQALRRKVPPLYGTEEVKAADKTVWIHYFGWSNADWYITEVDWKTGRAFGYADLGLGCGEWGYIDLIELEAVNAGPFGSCPERDKWWEPRRFADIDR